MKQKLLNIKNKILYILLICFQLQISKLAAQDNTMYMLHQLPQANILNPAVDFPCDFYIELPILSSTKFAYNNSSFTYKDFIRHGTGDMQDSLIMDFDNIYGKLRRNNYIHVELENVLLGAGFHWKEYFVSFRIYHTIHGIFHYKKDLVGLKNGNWDPTTDMPINYYLSNNEVNEVSYLGISAAISKEFSPGLRIGARVSYLKGTSNITSKESNLDIVTTDQPVSVTIQNNYNINASFPMEYQRDSAGRIYDINPVFSNFLGNFIFNSNRGLSFDIGTVYEYNDKLKLAASILNIGFIRWASNGINLQTNGNIYLIGQDLDQYTQTNQNTDLIQLLRDTISSSFHYYDSPAKYFSLLPITAFAGGSYSINPSTRINVVGKVFYFKGVTIPSITGAINLDASDYINLSASISYANRTIRNIGFAAIIGNSNMNFYFITDMLPVNYVREEQSGVLFPYNSRSLNFRFGINLLFGCGKSGSNGRSGGGKVCPAYR